MNIKVSIIDYDSGNLKSISNALKYLNFNQINFVNKFSEKFLESDCLILPGVGSFGHAMKNLNNTGLSDFVHKFVSSGKPILGICLGMHLLFESSEEMGFFQGLSLIEGDVKKLKKVSSKYSDYKIPNVRWSNLNFVKNNNFEKNPIQLNVRNNDLFYFIHSYYVDVKSENNVLAKSFFDGSSFSSVVRKKNIFGFQFHPEKSGNAGLNILKQFLSIVNSRKIND